MGFRPRDENDSSGREFDLAGPCGCEATIRYAQAVSDTVPDGDRALPTQVGLPDGTVTFVFTDVVGSTELWDQAPKLMREAMVAHDELVESAVEANSGMLVRPRGEGDSRFAVFRRASEAVAAAAQVLEMLENASAHTGASRYPHRRG
jgi:class 3 adenylate cyclase